MTQRAIALLGRKDEPTDAVEEYCRYLGSALRPYDIQLEIHCVPWQIHGWSEALNALRLQATHWRGTWVLVQYTALAWSERGFPQKLLHTVEILRAAGARTGVVFHDSEPYPGKRIVDRFRRSIQVRTMRCGLANVDVGIFTVPPEKISWRPNSEARVTFIPVGPNLPIPAEFPPRVTHNGVPVVGVFGITGGPAGMRETEVILYTVRRAAEQVGSLRLSVFGRHAELREQNLRDGLKDVPVELTVEGVITPAKVVERLSACDVLLFVRGGISSRRSSAIAGIACRVPVIACAGSETAYPITEAGVVLASPPVLEELPAALIRVLSDTDLRAALRLRNSVIYSKYFSWATIAARFAELLRH
jgi:hypothetical protein